MRKKKEPRYKVVTRLGYVKGSVIAYPEYAVHDTSIDRWIARTMTVEEAEIVVEALNFLMKKRRRKKKNG